MKILQGKILTDKGEWREQDLVIRGGRICQVGDSFWGETPKENLAEEKEETVIEGKGLYVLPGLVDIHLHGAMGCDFCDGKEESIQRIADYEAANGILAICPATMTVGEEKLSRILRTAADYPGGKGADLVGIHLEGPLLSPKRAGAQDPSYLQKGELSRFLHWMKESKNQIRILDVAPEMGDHLDFIRQVKDLVKVSLAHTDCDYETAKAAFLAGAGHLTHMFNAMPGLGHREPGPIPAALETGATVEVIADGIHIHPAMVRLAFALFGPDRIVLVSDSMEATGLEEGTYHLGGQEVMVEGSLAVLAKDKKVIAGSVTNLYGCMKRAVKEMGIPLSQAVRAASINPARVIGIDKDYGSLTPGKFGNAVLVDEELTIQRIIQKGICL